MKPWQTRMRAVIKRVWAVELLHFVNWFYAASGLAVGILVGLTGVGGGSLMTPLLVLLFHFHPATAVGTDLLYAAATKTAGTAVHGLKDTVDWRIVRRLASGSVPGAGLTLLMLSHIGPQSKAQGQLISFVLGVALLLTSVTILFRPQIIAFASRRLREPSERRVAALTVLTGLILGVLVSLTSVGAGALGVTALLLLYPRLPTLKIVGSDIAHAVPLTLVAGAGHWMLGTVNWHLLASLLVGSVPGIILGSLAATRAPDLLLRPILALTLILVGSRLVLP
jgi:uncharacterized membrane protein YfcA